MKESSLRDYFASTPGWRRQLAQLRKKCLAGYADGMIRLQDATPEECRAAEGLLGRHFVPPLLRYKMSDFEKALRDSRFAVTDLAEFWRQLDGEPLRSHARQKADRQEEVHRFFAREAAMPHGGAARSWLQAMEEEKNHGFGVLQDRIGQPEAARWLHWVCCTLDRRQQHNEPEELALCSYAVSTDPHALDGKNPAGSLLLHALAFWQGVPLPTRARQRLALLRRCGLMQDDISDFTVQRGLILTGADGREHPAWAPFRLAGKFCLLTSSQLAEVQGASSPTGRVYLLENQMLFSSLCRQSGLQHPLVCTSGQLKEASWQLLDLLAQTDCRLYYAGDFDPEGLSIADRLWQEYGDRVRFWHMEPQDYRRAISEKKIEGEGRLRQLEQIACPALRPTAQAVLAERRAGYQEALAEQYLEDLQNPGE
ncbi:TIGR02679 family protein [Gemmiger formicilis]|uniref:TIGR02679 family protein n=1 Tax=Gemmiger formicilis TaxID=745368 RepID=UPI00195D662C|nr:TIGR02679 family protein [Gemmiger formicilis]MBM6898390.1 TIGR02679 family protein [Gemmiger formicilis]